MDTIEQGLLRIDEHNASAIQKHKELFANSIYKSAQISNTCCYNLDLDFKKNFPEIETLGVSETEPFNPTTVVEIRDGKGYQVLDTWDKTDGFLPNRKIMGKYYVDIGEHIGINIGYCPTHKQIITTFQCNACGGSPRLNRHCNHSGSGFMYQCSCRGNVHINLIKSPDVDRKTERPLFMCTKTHEFIIDNYLNLYHTTSGLYIVFNKTSFPMIAFYLKKEMYISKRLGKLDITNILTESYQRLLDNRQEFLDNINQVIPENYQEIFDLFDRFRNFKSFKHNGVDNIDIAPTPEEIVDPRDNLIKSYKIRLVETIKRAEEAERIMDEMVIEYDKRSDEIKLLKYELGQNEMILQEKESDFKKQLLENNINQDNEKTNEIEGFRKTNFKLQKKLLEIKTYQTKVESLDMSYESLKRTNKDLMLKMEKNRNIIDRMIIQMKTKTKRIVTLQKDNSFISSKLLEVETKNTNKQRTIEKINVELKKSSEESSKLTRMIQSMGDKSSNALENALSNKLDLLEQKYSKKDNLSKRLEQQNVELRSQLKKYKNTLGGLLKLEVPVDDTNITDTNADNVMDSDEEVSNVSEVVEPTWYSHSPITTLPDKSNNKKRNIKKRKPRRR